MKKRLKSFRLGGMSLMKKRLRGTFREMSNLMRMKASLQRQRLRAQGQRPPTALGFCPLSFTEKRRA
jgi:hypothetical protein